MPPLPRILTVDPNGTIAHQVRSAYDLLDQPVIQIDVPNGVSAQEELLRAPCDAIISAWACDENRVGWQLAAEVKQQSPDTDVILLAGHQDTELDEETISSSPFVYFRRPLQADAFLRVLHAITSGLDVFEAMQTPQGQQAPQNDQFVMPDYGPVPNINVNNAAGVLDMLLSDLNALAILLATRDGTVLLERGTLGEIDRQELVNHVIPAISTNLSLREIVGGNIAALQFYDGQTYDLYVVTVGLHHFMCIVYDGDKGARELGAVSRFGRRTAEDLIALLGAEAWMMIRPEMIQEIPQPETQSRRAHQPPVDPSIASQNDVELAPSGLTDELSDFQEEIVDEDFQMDAIDNFDVDSLFNVGVDGDADLFDDFDALAELARDEGGKGTLTADQARELGLLDS